LVDNGIIGLMDYGIIGLYGLICIDSVLSTAKWTMDNEYLIITFKYDDYNLLLYFFASNIY